MDHDRKKEFRKFGSKGFKYPTLEISSK